MLFPLPGADPPLSHHQDRGGLLAQGRSKGAQHLHSCQSCLLTISGWADRNPNSPISFPLSSRSHRPETMHCPFFSYLLPTLRPSLVKILSTSSKHKTHSEHCFFTLGKFPRLAVKYNSWDSNLFSYSIWLHAFLTYTFCVLIIIFSENLEALWTQVHIWKQKWNLEKPCSPQVRKRTSREEKVKVTMLETRNNVVVGDWMIRNISKSCSYIGSIYNNLFPPPKIIFCMFIKNLWKNKQETNNLII